MSRRTRRKFTPEQRAQAVRIVKESGKSIRQVAEDLDLPTPMETFVDGSQLAKDKLIGQLAA